MIAGVLTIIALYLVIVIVSLGLGIGLGYLVNWMLPVIGLGSAVVASVIANIFAILGVVRFLMLKMPEPNENDDDDQLPPPIVYMMDPITSRQARRRRRKQD